jgi:hypothetical protein
MKNNRMIAVLAMVAFLVFASTLVLANASGNAIASSVWTTTSGISSSPHQLQFNPGDVVYVWWDSYPIGSTVDITVTPPGGSYVTPIVFTGVRATVDAPVSFTASSPGVWTVSCTGADTLSISVSTLFVIPESVLGTLIALAAGFAGVAVVTLVKRAHPKTA